MLKVVKAWFVKQIRDLLNILNTVNKLIGHSAANQHWLGPLSSSSSVISRRNNNGVQKTNLITIYKFFFYFQLDRTWQQNMQKRGWNNGGGGGGVTSKMLNGESLLLKRQLPRITTAAEPKQKWNAESETVTGRNLLESGDTFKALTNSLKYIFTLFPQAERILEIMLVVFSGLEWFFCFIQLRV